MSKSFITEQQARDFANQNKLDIVIYKNQVLDITDFKHPGPQNLLTDNLGKDITALFEENDHSNYAVELCSKMTIGFISGPQIIQHDDIKLSQEEMEMHARIDKMIDIRKPLIPQVQKMTNKEFMALVRRPRHIDNEDGIILHAEDDESKKTYYMDNVKVIGSIVVLMIFTSYHTSKDWVDFLCVFVPCFAVGFCVMWTFLEYF